MAGMVEGDLVCCTGATIDAVEEIVTSLREIEISRTEALRKQLREKLITLAGMARKPRSMAGSSETAW